MKNGLFFAQVQNGQKGNQKEREDQNVLSCPVDL